jgi:hypothetical protein
VKGAERFIVVFGLDELASEDEDPRIGSVDYVIN